METNTELEPAARGLAAMAEHGITVDSEFVPWSKAKHREGEKADDVRTKALHWRVTVKRNGRPILTADYSAGIAHAPYYKKIKGAWSGISMFDASGLEYELEHGYPAKVLDHANTSSGHEARRLPGAKPILPEPESVLWSLLQDSDVLNHSKFEDWAAEYGYDVDSRKAEGIYRACLEIALALRNGLGETILAELNDAFEGY